MTSPYVRRLRLGEELEARLKRAKFSHQDVANQLGWSRSKVTRIVGGDMVRPNEAEIVKMLQVLGVNGKDFTRLRAMARDAAHRGWWVTRAGAMGQRQAMFADLESGAQTIHEFAQVYVPGLLQIPEYVRAVSEYDDLSLAGSTPEPGAMISGRAARQEMMRAPDGPRFEAVIDENVISRPAVPHKIMAEQLRYLSDAGDHIAVLVLPTDADIESFSVPKSGFSLFTYRDPTDGTIAVVDTVTSDLVLTNKDEVQQYERLYNRLREAALSAQDSAHLLAKAADNMLERSMS